MKKHGWELKADSELSGFQCNNELVSLTWLLINPYMKGCITM